MCSWFQVFLRKQGIMKRRKMQEIRGLFVSAATPTVRQLIQIQHRSSPISYGCPVRNSSDLIAIIPPCHDSCILRSVISQPPVGLAVIVKFDNTSITQPCLHDDTWVRQILRQSPAIVLEVNTQNITQEKDEARKRPFCNDPFFAGQGPIQGTFERGKSIKTGVGRRWWSRLLPIAVPLLFLRSDFGFRRLLFSTC